MQNHPGPPCWSPGGGVASKGRGQGESLPKEVRTFLWAQRWEEGREEARPPPQGWGCREQWGRLPPETCSLGHSTGLLSLAGPEFSSCQ